MPFPFSLICDLLEHCHLLTLSKKGNTNAVLAWFTRHRDRINAHDTSIAALLSTLLPERRTDRVYCIQTSRLEKIIGRALMLGSSRIAELALYKTPGHNADLGDCVERVLSVTPNPTCVNGSLVTVEEIDAILHRLASKTKWSSPSIRASQTKLSTRNRNELEDVYRQLSPREAKWFTRLVLKDYRPLILEPDLLYRLCDPLLPNVLKIQDDFATAIGVVSSIRATLLPNALRKTSGKEQILSKIKPRLGVKVGRQQWMKGRSIKNCLDMGHGRMSVEEKLDGEYCQIHVDITKGTRKVQIFSKSGKDSTEDRHDILNVVLDSLKLGQPDCRIRKGCILEGELLVYDHKEQRILPFHKIRKYVSRRGRFLNTEQDSQPKPHEKLMIVYYDLLLLDDESLLNLRQSERFKLLQDLIHSSKGHAELVGRKVIDFGCRSAGSELRKLFARTICLHGEGLVLKPDDPYFDFKEDRVPFSSCCIKLKKEYIGHFGDVGDFAVVGAGFDPAKAKSYRIPNLKWTHFFIACLNNKEEVKRWNAVPVFTVVNRVEVNESLLRTLINFGNPMPVPASEQKATRLHIAPGIPDGTPLSVAFTNPLVFDLRCFSFDNVGNTGFWSPRFPTVTKIHFDRDYTDTISFDELQSLAVDATTIPELEDSQENLRWIAELENADPRGIAVDATSQLTATTIPTPSPQNSTQTHSEVSNSSTVAASGVLNKSIGRLRDLSVAATRILTLHVLEQLVTPPTSSPPGESEPQVSRDQRNSKRTASLPCTHSPSTKRRRVSTQSKALPASDYKARKQPQKRNVLEDIDGNSSQRSASFKTSFTADGDDSFGKGPAITSARTSIVVSAEIENNDPSKTSELVQQQSEHALAADSAQTDAAAFLEPSISSPPSKERSSGFLRDEAELYEFRAGNICKHGGAECPLADSVVLIPPTTLERHDEILTLLRDHGVHVLFDNIGKLVQQKTQVSTFLVDELARPLRTILLVDSIDNKSEAKALLCLMETTRAEVLGHDRDWIGVYDWRLLQEVTALEGRSTKTSQSRKHDFSGFRNPWQRWHCGII